MLRQGVAFPSPSITRICCKDAGMNPPVVKAGRWWLLWCGLAIPSLGAGCLQSVVGGQTLPSAYYLDDDVQYFPAGPETKLANQIRALERYKLERQAQQDGLTAEEYQP
jgi:hypothetical protein